MIHRLSLLLCLWLALPALAQATECHGLNLIDAMTADQRAAIEATVASQPYPEGNHWRATKGSRTIDVIGTFHVDDARMDPVLRALSPTIRGADLVWLEATDVEIAELKKALGSRADLLFTSGPTLPERLDEQDWAALSSAMSERGVPAFFVAKLQPWYVSMLLAMPACALAGQNADGPGGLDGRILTEAHDAGVAVRALEPYDTAFRVFAAIPQDQQLDLVRTALSTASDAQNLFATMTDLYFAEDHRMIWEFARERALASMPDDPAARAANDTIDRMLVDDRNRAWIARIEETPLANNMVIAVGAGHLGGPEGLLALLAADGYRLERQPFK